MVITDIEAALIDQIKQAAASHVRIVASLPAFWTADLLTRASQNAPGVYVRWGGGQSQGNNSLFKSRWVLTVAVKSAAAGGAPRTGHPTHIGAYDLVELLARKLNGCTLAGEGSLTLTGCKPVLPEAVETLGMVLYDVTFDLSHDMGDPVDEARLADFTTLELMIDLPPADGTPEISGTVELAQ